MTASAALVGYSATMSVSTTPGGSTYTKLGEVTSITPPNLSIDQVEVTHLESPGRTKEFISGLADPGDMTAEMNWIPGAATDDFILAWRASGETRNVKITYPGVDLAVDIFPAFVKGYVPAVGGPGDKLHATLTLKVAGAVVRS